MSKNLKTPTAECLENGNYHVYWKFSNAKQHFLKWIPVPENVQESENKQNKIKEN